MSLAPRLKAPRGACDTHIHFYDPRVPPAPGGPPLPGEFTVPMYRALQQRLGLSRVVVVQPNAYQDDNRVTIDAIQAIGREARGVGVVRPGVSDAEIERLTQAGIRAQRVFALRWGAIGFDQMDAVMARVHPFGWHANIQLDGRDLPAHETQIKRLPGQFVIDHVGKYLEPVSPEHESFRALLRLVDTGRCSREAVGALRDLADRRAEIRGCGATRQGARESGAAAHAVGEQLAASVSTERRSARRRAIARPAARLGAGRRDAQNDPGRQSGGAVRL